jgi:ferrous iron transport protein B
MSVSVAAPGNLTESTTQSMKTVALVGPPNCGKTTVFNRLTGLRQRVGNFPGVTVEHHTGYVRDDAGSELAIIDLPGVYSLTPKS